MADKPKKRILAKPEKGQSFQEALAATNRQYGETLSRLADRDEISDRETAPRKQTDLVTAHARVRPKPGTAMNLKDALNAH